MDVATLRMVPLIRVGSAFEAKVLAARLGSEGILFELRGNLDGVYPVGDVTVLVPEGELIEAQELLAAGGDAGDLEAEARLSTADDGDIDERSDPRAFQPWTARPLWRTAALVVLAALAAVAARTLLFQPGALPGN
jgi:hypothetical protein